MEASVTLAILISWLLQHAKSSSLRIWAGINRDNPTLLRILSAIAAALTAAGITWSFSDGTLLISGLTVSNAALLLWNAVQQFVLQEASFRALFQTRQNQQNQNVTMNVSE